MYIYNSPIFAVDTAETKRYAGLQKADFDMKLIEEACTETQLLIQPKGVWQIYDYLPAEQKVITEAGEAVILQGKSIGKHLRNAQKVVFLSATIGEDIENQITKSFADGRYSFSMLLDAAATTAIEQVADGMEKAIFNEIKRQGFAMTWRFSPGYSDWPIEQQPEVLKLTHGSKIGVSLTESLMLMPRKSITAVIGLFYPEDACNKLTEQDAKHNCSQCDKLDCPARKEVSA